MAAGDVIDVMGFEAGDFLGEALISSSGGGAVTETVTNARSEFRLRILRASGLVV